jgi:hypothetical protein
MFWQVIYAALNHSLYLSKLSAELTVPEPLIPPLLIDLNGDNIDGACSLSYNPLGFGGKSSTTLE